eukprot:TRINITY_DN15653_c0_g1_i1.p1 TRINITY_DN15653_c0_g1~~TRINITY_DN15653_c0_g1_i1.p1  ORF type:complete len:412 (-),score=52.05 TRINITY_DN15653_c0_g1_i1:81-1133(-)
MLPQRLLLTTTKLFSRGPHAHARRLANGNCLRTHSTRALASLYHRQQHDLQLMLDLQCDDEEAKQQKHEHEHQQNSGRVGDPGQKRQQKNRESNDEESLRPHIPRAAARTHVLRSDVVRSSTPQAPASLYCESISSPEDRLLASLRKETGGMPGAHMQLSNTEGKLITTLVRLTGSKNALDIGTFTGYSALCIARGLPRDGVVLSLDKDRKSSNVARRYWELSECPEKMKFQLGPALASLELIRTNHYARQQALTPPYDFAFVDADKANYGNYFDVLLDLVRPGGLMVFDNTLFSGKVCAYDQGETEAHTARETRIAKGLHEFNQRVAADSRVYTCNLPVFDGLLLAYKL